MSEEKMAFHDRAALVWQARGNALLMKQAQRLPYTQNPFAGSLDCCTYQAALVALRLGETCFLQTLICMQYAFLGESFALKLSGL